ncbi:MAG: VWA domain-containing protein [Pyrinomonadaceae bacterium]
MFLSRVKFLVPVLFLIFANNLWAQSGVRTAPTPPTEPIEKVSTEEIKLNVLATKNNGDFAAALKPEDLVILEDGRIQQASSVRRIPANVLFLLDVGTEIPYAIRNKVTAETARNLVNALSENDSVAVMQYGDKVDILSYWTKDKSEATAVLSEQKLGFGKHSVFNEAMQKAIEFFDKTPLENRHLILITDGVDSFGNAEQSSEVTRKLLSSDINVHVISYTQLQQKAIGTTKTVTGGGTRPKPLPPGAGAPHSNEIQNFPIFTVNLDREMIRKRREESEKLRQSEKYLTTIAEDTNGEIFLPDTTDEMIAKTGILARTIDSQYVVTYIPKRPLDESKGGEIRSIEVSSRRPGVEVQGKRKFIVTNFK